MVLTPSLMIPLGTKAPDFKLTDAVSGKQLSLDELKSDKATVVMFICNHCPYVKHIQDGLIALTNDYIAKGVSFIAINSNDVEKYTEDSPEKMKELAQKLNYKFPYLFDETQEVAKAYSATCTPDFFIFDKELKCVYRGQLDDSRPGNDLPVTGKDIRSALDNLLEGKSINEIQKASIGCNIKWKS
jgi:thiol-disulfide isomerase/thioredoxin